MKKRDAFRKLPLVSDDAGNVESTLTLIPLMAVFLGVLQISSFALSHEISSNIVQGQISRASLLGNSFLSKMESIDSSLNIRRIELSGGGAILIKSIENIQFPLSPFSLGDNKFTVTGIAIDEN